METKNYSIVELNAEAAELNEIMNDMLNAQMQAFRLQALASWEKNHAASQEKWQEKIAELRKLKSYFNEQLKAMESDDLLFDFRLSIEVGVKRKNELKVQFEREHGTSFAATAS